MKSLSLLSISKRVTLHPFRTLRSLWYRLFHACRAPHDIVCSLGEFSLKLQSDSVLAEPLYVGTGFEDNEMNLLRHVMKPGMRVIDVGANIGLYSIFLAKAVGPSGHVWSFEPFPPIMHYLKQNVKRNKLSNVTTVEKAVAETKGTLDFYVFPAGYDVYNSLGASRREQENMNAVRKTQVDVTTLDSFLDNAGVDNIDILKIDVEGMEERVLQGAEHILHRSEKVCILTEMYAPSAEQCGCSLNRIVKMMEKWGFTMFEIMSDGDIHRVDIEELSSVYAFFKRI